MRLFTAISVPTKIHPTLQLLQNGLAGANWRPKENFHITLQFYNEVEPHLVSALDDALQQIEFPVLSLRICGLGTFGGKQPFVLWAGVDGVNKQDQIQLRELAMNCLSAAKSAGIVLKSAKYTPHITLAYCKGARDSDIAQYLQARNGFLPVEFSSNTFALYQSKLGNHPAHYEIISQYERSE